MQHAFVGRTGIKVSRLALGTMTFGGEADRETSAAIYRRARDAGIDLFDTADIYQKGVSEEILGALIRGERDRIVLASKAYFPSGARGPNDRGSSRLHLVRSVEGSLRRLGTDRIELYYLHRFDERTDLEESLRGLEQLVQSGKILYPAVSNFAAWQVSKALGIQRMRGWAPLAAIQPMYSLVKRQAEVELLPMAQDEGLAVFPYSPLGGGLLSGKYGVHDRPSAGRLVDWEVYRVRYGDPSVYETADRFVALARDHGWHPAALAVAWVASHPAVTAPLLGARSVAQLDAVLGAVDIGMTCELRESISLLSTAPPPATDRTEEGLVAIGGDR
ncbi:aldo/keto reductase [Sandaracinus amylolyticus]|nr:aldo/keto reductase [Sandaracinus amylolyticus]